MDKQEFRSKAHIAVEKLISNVENLEKKKDEVSADMKAKYNQQIANLRQKKAELQENLERIEAEQDENWQERKEIFNNSLEHYKAGFEELGKLFKS